MNKMGKGKATSIDGISDVIFKKSTWKNLWQKFCKEYGVQDENMTE